MSSWCAREGLRQPVLHSSWEKDLWLDYLGWDTAVGNEIKECSVRKALDTLKHDSPGAMEDWPVMRAWLNRLYDRVFTEVSLQRARPNSVSEAIQDIDTDEVQAAIMSAIKTDTAACSGERFNDYWRSSGMSLMDMYSVPGCDALLQLHITPTLKGSTFLCLVCSSVNKLSIENKWGRKAGESKDGKGLIAHVRQHAAGDMHIRCMQSVRYSARQTFKMVAQEVSPWRVISDVTCMHVEQMVRDSTRGVFRCRDTMTWQKMISTHTSQVCLRGAGTGLLTVMQC